MIIIGITGTIGAGKGTVVNALKAKGFKHFSAREFISQQIVKQSLPVNRDTMTQVANALRVEHSPEYIISQLYEQAFQSKENCVIESVRNTYEIDFLKSKENFFLLAVDADIELRYKRIKLRKSQTDMVSFAIFASNEKREWNNTEDTKQKLKACIESADYSLTNNGTIEELNQKVDKILASIEKKVQKKDFRPSWDEYFLEIVDTVAKRATCDRGRSGCVIVKDKQILVSGYVGSPKGLPHCDQIGHLFKKMIDEDGNISNHCVRTVHAEQNAICQAAKRGIALNGSTLYCTMTPCHTCAMMIINCGIERVVCKQKYHSGQESEEIFAQAGIKLDFACTAVLKYNKQ
jgi:Deoxycytidylate deaminase